MRRVHLRKSSKIAKGALIHAAALNVSLIPRHLLGVGTARRDSIDRGATGIQRDRVAELVAYLRARGLRK